MDQLPTGKHVILDCSGAFNAQGNEVLEILENVCLLYTSPSPRDRG